MRVGRFGSIVLVVALGLTVGAAGVTGAAVVDKSPLPKKAYIKAADSICTQSKKLINAAGAAIKVPQGQNPTTAQLQAFVSSIEPIFTQEVDSLRALPAPKADVKKLKSIYNQVDKGYKEIVADPSILTGSRSPTLAKASKQAKAYGFKVCGA